MGYLLALFLITCLVISGIGPLFVQAQGPVDGRGNPPEKKPRITQAEREAAAKRAAEAGFELDAIGMADMAMPGMAPRYFSHPNYANSPLPGNIVVEWNAIAQEIVQPMSMGDMMMGETSMATAFVYMSYVQAAVYDALVAIEGGYRPYSLQEAADPNASREAAVATAAYTVLKRFFPDETILDGRYTAALAAIAEGDAKIDGIAIGEAAADATLAAREDDGLLAEGTYIVPEPGPGIWEPTMMMPPIDPWVALLRPFTMESPNQFRPAPPPTLDSDEWAAQMNAVKDLGSATSESRTAEQSAIAQYWAANGVRQFNGAYRNVAMNHGMNLIDTARLMAMGNMVGTDALIGAFDSKYSYSFWRPITAIHNADNDGNSGTEADTDWEPLMMTPNHPEYVAAHSSFVAAQAAVLAEALGTNQVDLDLTNHETGVTRHYPTTADLREEVGLARVWGGLHYPMSTELGDMVGQSVAANALDQYFGTAESRSEHAAFSGGIRKFVDGLPGLGPDKANNLGQYIPVAVPDTTTYPGADYYEIAVIQYREQMHSDLPPTLLRGYVQLSTGVVPGEEVPLLNAMLDGSDMGTGHYGVTPPHYLGPTIIAQKDRPVRIKFYNLLPTGMDGDLFIPVDTTVMGSGPGAEMEHHMQFMDPLNPMCGMMDKPYECYTENRATLHLHGGVSPWISDGTPHQWITPAGEDTPYPQGVSVVPVPDMDDSGDPNDGIMTFYYTNQQSARLMFYHDHAWGITRLNVYAGEAAGYLLTDDTEQDLIAAGIIPDEQIPLIIQDKTFVPSMEQLATQDETWDMMRWGGMGNLWMPHVYSPAQNPEDIEGVNQFGRWMYGPWFWPPTNSIDYGAVPNPYYDQECVDRDDPDEWCEPYWMPGTPYNSMGMEAFMDTPVVNGTAYPTLTVDPRSYRFRVLNAANDRFFNLSWYVADESGTEVALNAAEVEAALEDPAGVFPTPDESISPKGPDWIQIGTEGGFLPAPAVIPAQPTTWVTDPTLFNAGNVDKHSLLVAPAERADVIVDFSQYAGQTLILYNDAPAAFPARDPRYDYYTGSPDLRDTGGVDTILPGYGPNTRTVMQVVVAGAAPAPEFDLEALQTAFRAESLGGRGVFENGQNPIIVGQSEYNLAYDRSFRVTAPRNGTAGIHDFSLTFDTLSGQTLTMPLQNKQIQDEMGEAFEPEYGRMSGFLGVEVPNAQAGLQNMILYGYVFPPSEVLKGVTFPEGVEITPITTTEDGTQLWKITHNGVDTHPIHWHLYEVQVLNRVGWDGIIRKPHASELGWKDTLRISPLEDTIVALRPIVPRLPWDLPNSIRLLDPSMPEGAYLANTTQAELDGKPIMAFDPNGEPIDIINHYVNFGWEYVWHCHILSHEEMDMMRPQVVGVAPRAPTGLAISVQGTRATLTWADNSLNETSFIVQRANDGGFTSGLTLFELPPNTTSYIDNTIKNNTTYYYRIVARNLVGDTWDYSDPNLNEGASFPTLTMDSDFSNTVMLGNVPAAPAAPTNLAAILRNGPQVELTWRDNSNNETGFVVERAVDGVNFSVLTTVGANTTSYVDTTVMAGNTYSYRVQAVNAGGGSAYSNTASISVPAVPAAPSSLTGTAARQGNNARVTLNWVDNANDETGFTIQRATNLNFTASLTTSTVAANTTTFNTGNIARNTTYYFRVRAFNQSGNSAWSNIYIVTTP
jgi:FtsP/CotA-like multicopper oxidase with cupredoxin domain